MQNRRGFLIKVAAGFAAMAMVVVGTVLADELLGVISKVDVEGKKITVIEKDTDKEIEIKVTDETEASTKGGLREDRPREAGRAREEDGRRRQEGRQRQDHAREGRGLQDRVHAEEEGRVIPGRGSDERREARARDVEGGNALPPSSSCALSPVLRLRTPHFALRPDPDSPDSRALYIPLAPSS